MTVYQTDSLIKWKFEWGSEWLWRVSYWLGEQFGDKVTEYLSASLIEWKSEWVSDWGNDWVRKLASSKSGSRPVYKEQLTDILVIGKSVRNGRWVISSDTLKHSNLVLQRVKTVIYFTAITSTAAWWWRGGKFRLQWSWFAYTWLRSFVGICSNSFCINWLRSWSLGSQVSKLLLHASHVALPT
jgi:hypothetical protein